MGTVFRPDRNTFDLVIVVDDIDAIKVWSEQIECALAGHFDRDRNHFKSTIKLLFLLDIKHQTFDSQTMKQWIEHFCRGRHREVMCAVVDSTSNRLDCSCADMGKKRMKVVKTDDIANFYNWWPSMVEFLLLHTKAAPKFLNYLL